MQADQGARQVKQALEQIVPPFVADAGATATEHPREGPLDHPPVATEPLAGVDPPTRETRGDAAGTQGTAQGQGVVGLVAVQLRRARARASRVPPRADDRRDGVNQRQLA